MIPSRVSEPLAPQVDPERIIGCYTQGQPGPLIVAMGGIHGNEPSGPMAIRKLLDELERRQPPIAGAVLGLAGNLEALRRKQRFVDEDLNRCFRAERIESLWTRSPAHSEERELLQVATLLGDRAAAFDDLCFVDCHTTSGRSIPYISVNAHPDSLLLAERFPLHAVVGLEQSIPGCFAEYYNKRDRRGFTFEAGQHDEPASVANHLALLTLFLCYTGAVAREDLPQTDERERMLADHVAEGRRTFRLAAHYRIESGERFAMRPGYANFDPIRKGETLANNRFGPIHAPCDGRILMPLYQKQGDDGFFVLEED